MAALTLLLVLLAFARPLDHDESQYVASAALAGHGLPYRDFAYLQTPLQPVLFAPVAAALGAYAWPGLRLLNALLGAVAVAGVFGAARRGGAGERRALAAAGLFASCDIFLFAVGVARNDALPAALLAGALVPICAAEHTRRGAFLAGLLLAGAAAAKVSFALPAVAYGAVALVERRRLPLWVALGALLPAGIVALCRAAAPEAFGFEVFGFPAHAPADYYAAGPRAWKLWGSVKALDLIKFLALGPALLALVVVARARRREVLGVLTIAGLIAAALPTPTWRQYLLPALPPLFVLLALTWQSRPTRGWRIAAALFAAAGTVPSVGALVDARHGLPLVEAMRQGAAIRAAMDRAGVSGPVATLSPQFLPATGRLPDARFATGPFYWRARALLDAAAERRLGLVSARRIDPAGLPLAVLVGGEGAWTSGDAALDAALEAAAIRRGLRAVPVAGGRFRLYAAR